MYNYVLGLMQVKIHTSHRGGNCNEILCSASPLGLACCQPGAIHPVRDHLHDGSLVTLTVVRVTGIACLVDLLWDLVQRVMPGRMRRSLSMSPGMCGARLRLHVD